MSKVLSLIPSERIEQAILLIRGEKVMLDADLAEMYGVKTQRLVEAVKRNLHRFPDDFMFRLEYEEIRNMRSQLVTSCVEPTDKARDFRTLREGKNNQGNQEDTNLITQSATSSLKQLENVRIFSPGVLALLSHGGRRKLPYVFTEQGVAMLSSVLNSPRAVSVNIEIMRAFVRLRKMIASHAELARKLAAMENKYDAQFKVVFDAIRELMIPPAPAKKRKSGSNKKARQFQAHPPVFQY